MVLAHNSSKPGPLGSPTVSSGLPRAGSKELCASVGRAVVRAARAVHWYVTSLMGDNAYATYVAHQRRTHPDTEPLTERQFWRQRMDDQDRNPGARCC
ncbi:Uncharacterized short protein YbdD, DUF466 family [Microbacterium sp. cf332]|nr:Uncharacterized short protein YbdD, DUF466 family [Microbacterium sp. cf332]